MLEEVRETWPIRCLWSKYNVPRLLELKLLEIICVHSHLETF